MTLINPTFTLFYRGDGYWVAIPPEKKTGSITASDVSQL